MGFIVSAEVALALASYFPVQKNGGIAGQLDELMARAERMIFGTLSSTHRAWQSQVSLLPRRSQAWAVLADQLSWATRQDHGVPHAA